MPRGTGSPGSVTSTAAWRSSASSSLASSARAARCAAARARRARGSAPGRARRAAPPAATPSSRRASVSALERPSASTRASSSSAAVVARREQLAPLAFEAGGVLHGHPRVGAGTREASPAVPPCLRRLRRRSLLAHSVASRPAREVNFGGPSTRGLSVSAPLPGEDGARLLVSVGAGTAILPPYERSCSPVARPTSSWARSTTAGAPASTTTSRSTCWPARAPTGRSSSSAPAAGASRVELARHGHRVIALDAAPAMLAEAEARRAPPRRRATSSRPSSATCATPPALDRRATASSRPSGRSCTSAATTSGVRALRAAGALLAPGGQFIFDVFEPTAADIRATHDRWIHAPRGHQRAPAAGTPRRAASRSTCACPTATSR